MKIQMTASISYMTNIFQREKKEKKIQQKLNWQMRNDLEWWIGITFSGPDLWSREASILQFKLRLDYLLKFSPSEEKKAETKKQLEAEIMHNIYADDDNQDKNLDTTSQQIKKQDNSKEDRKIWYLEILFPKLSRQFSTIKTIGVVKRISVERSEKIGGIVGYQIRLENKISSSIRLTFCTTGILLN